MAYSFSNDVYKPIAKQIVDKFNMHYIDLDTICFITNDSGSPSDYAARIRKFRPPYDLFIDYNFYIEIFSKKMELLNENQVKAVIYHMLLSIDADGESIRKPDVTDFSTILSMIGPHWLYNPAIPDILTVPSPTQTTAAPETTPVSEPSDTEEEEETSDASLDGLSESVGE